MNFKTNIYYIICTPLPLPWQYVVLCNLTSQALLSLNAKGEELIIHFS